ncbi:MAG: DUF308 domain-containing protein [Saprospiraceae bacterium]|nr:DUF308 domain-containing protein [Saprospiraceae bacterium]
MFTNKKDIIRNSFHKGLWQDSLPSLQPEGTYREAWNAVRESDSENSFGISNENSNELLVNIEGEVRGLIFAEERDQYVAFVWNPKGVGELGIIDVKKQEYKVLTTSTDLDMSCDEWIDAELKVVQPCNQLHLYFSTRDVYKYVNLDDPCCEFEVKELLRPECVPAFASTVFKRAGQLPNGTYWFFARLRDKEGNDSNWFKISSGIHISGGDHRQGEISKHAINVKLSGLPKDFNLVDLGVISTIGGLTSVEHFDTLSYGEGNIDYLYRGKTGHEVTLNIADVRSRNSRYIRGKNLMQYDGRLVLYNVRNDYNLDYQRQANQIETFYDVWAVPSRYAEDYKGLRPNENYMFAIQWHYVDGTSSPDFVINGRKATASDLEELQDPCGDCRLPRWRLEDTSSRTDIFLDDVLVKNDDYNDDVEVIDNDRDGNFRDDDPSDDEKDTINPEVIDEFPPGERPFDTEIDKGENDLNAQLDCLCERIDALVRNRLANCDFCEDDDLSTWATIFQIQCMCENRISFDSPPGDTGGGNLTAEQEQLLSYLAPLQSGALFQSGSGGSCAGGNCSGGCAGGSCGSGSCGAGGCGGCGGSGCGGGSSSCSGGCSGTKCGTVVDNTPIPRYTTSGEGRFPAQPLNYARNIIQNYTNELNNEISKYIVCSTCDTVGCTGSCGSGSCGCVAVKSNIKCFQEGRKQCDEHGCYICQDGYWVATNGVVTYDFRPSYQRTAKTPIVTDGLQALQATRDSFSFEYVYDEDGCEVVGVKPKKYSTGKFGYWETKEKYPLTEDCNCELIYGEIAGQNVVLHKVPSISKEPHFVSFSGGVPNMFDSANMEDKNAFVFFISPRFTGITPPKNLPKPLCPNNPFSINYVERTEANKTVIGSGLAISCFKGEIQGEPFVFPKHGVNSWERFDRSIEPSGLSTFRGGTKVDTVTPYDPTPANVAPYIIHSLDFHLRRPPLDANDCLFELEVYGKGFRHGLGAEGEKAETMFQERRNQKGTRQSLLLNHYRRVRGNTGGYVTKCVNAIAEAPTDSNVSKSDEFGYSLCNLWRESSIYSEMEGPLVEFREGDNWVGSGGVVHDMDGFYGGDDHVGDNASDRSFTGDTLWHQLPIHDIRGHLVTFTRYLPYQYGSPISQTYIPLGMEGNALNLATGTIDGVTGDSFVGYASFRRTAYVSDKTGRRITSNLFLTGLESSTTVFAKILRNLVSFIFRSLGIRNGGYIPKSGDNQDYINIFGGLRRHKDSITGGIISHGERRAGEYPQPRTPINPAAQTDRNAGDNYFYHLLKSNVWTWMNSDVNPAYRETGSTETMEVYWPKLKNLKLDSSYPDGFDWAKTYLNRFYCLWIENAKWKLIFMALFLLAFVYGIGFWLIIEGIKNIVVGAQAIGGGDYTLQTIGGVIGMLIGFVLFFVGFGWIVFWIKSDQDNKLAENLVGLKNIRPDVKNSREPAAKGNYPTYAFDTRRIKQFEDNFWGYNPDNIIANIHEPSHGMPDPYNTCVCPEKRSTRVPYSNKQNIESPIDSWRNFKLNNYVSIPPDTGTISKIFKLGNKVFVHTTDMLLELQTGDRQVSLDKGKLLLGSGDLFGAAMPIYGGVVEGFAGLLDPNSAYVSNWGYIFPDRESKQVFMFNGGMPTPISDLGVRGFMHENMGFALLDKFKDFKNVDQKSKYGIGYSFGIDHQHNRLLFTKKDYKVKDGVKMTLVDGVFHVGDKVISIGDPEYFVDNSFTRSYYPVTKEWIGRSHYTPNLYAWDRFSSFSFDDKGMWKHNIKGSYQNFYGTYYPFVVDVVVRDRDLGFSFIYEGTILDTEAFKWNGCDFIRNPKVTFNKVGAFNSFQFTGMLDTRNTEELSVVDRSIQNHDIIDINYDHRLWTFNTLRDRLRDPNELMFDCESGNSVPIPNEYNLSENPSSALFNDNYLIYRFVFDSEENVKLFMKNVFTKVDKVTL